MKHLQTILQESNLRLTSPRRAVFLALQQSKLPLTVSEIAKACPNINRASVYRIIETFQDLGIIAPIYAGWRAYYELAEPFLPHHHHLICKSCKSAESIQNAQLEAFIKQIGQQYQFAISSHYFELEGICRNCKK